MSFESPFFRSRDDIEVDIDWEHLANRGRSLLDMADQIEATVRTGQVDWGKSRQFPDRPYDKFCLHRYFGKEKRTIEVILLYNRDRNLGQVMTVWVRTGRKARRRAR